MNRNIFLLAIGAFFFLTACNKSVSNSTTGLAPLAPANEDLSAGSWKTVEALT